VDLVRLVHDSTAFWPSPKKFNEDLCAGFSYVSCFVGQLLPLVFSSIISFGGQQQQQLVSNSISWLLHALCDLCNSLPRTPKKELKTHLRNTTSQNLISCCHYTTHCHAHDPQHMPQIIKFFTHKKKRKKKKPKEILVQWKRKESSARLDKLQFRCNTCKLLKFCQATTVMAIAAITVSPPPPRLLFFTYTFR